LHYPLNMSDAVLDRGVYFPSPMTFWHRERPFKVAFAVSVVVHAVLIALIPGFRSVTIQPPRVLDVEIVATQEPAVALVQEQPVAAPKLVEPKPEPLVRQPEPELPPPPRTEIIAAPRAVPEPELAVPKPELRPEPKAEPRPESRPEPTIEPRPEPPPVARVEPRPEPRPEPITQIRPEPAPVAIAPPPPPPVAIAPPPSPPPPVAAAQPQVVPQMNEALESRLLSTYGQSISKEIKRFQKYPVPAQRRGWQGTAEILLKIAADGKVTSITLAKSSGYAILDEEALEMVRRASPLPQAPADLRGRALAVSVPIVFRLQNS
jgi:protein TonB